MLELILADVMQRLRFSCGNVRGSSVGSLRTVDDENLASGLGQTGGLHQSLEAHESSRVRCCGLDDAFLAGAVWHEVWHAQRGHCELHAVLQDAHDRWTWEPRV